MKLRAIIALAAIAGIPACADSSSGPEARGFEIQVAPLELAEIVDTCYRATVYNTTNVSLFAAGNNTVWSQQYICATQYGDSLGSVTYIGTCDADGGTAANPVLNTVELELQAILVADADAADLEPNDPATPWDESTTDTLVSPRDYFNPCQAPDFCRLQRPCIENMDTLVEFNLTVMRAAKQGFFDIAVNFEDIFCSAKFDCQYPDLATDSDGIDEAITLIFDENGTRRDTGVLGFACTAGTATALEAGDTYLYMDDFTVRCSDDENNTVWTETFDAATDEPGNQFFPPRPMVNTALNSIHCVCGGGEIDDCTSEPCDTDVGGRCNAACAWARTSAGSPARPARSTTPLRDMAAPSSSTPSTTAASSSAPTSPRPTGTSRSASTSPRWRATSAR